MNKFGHLTILRWVTKKVEEWRAKKRFLSVFSLTVYFQEDHLKNIEVSLDMEDDQNGGTKIDLIIGNSTEWLFGCSQVKLEILHETLNGTTAWNISVRYPDNNRPLGALTWEPNSLNNMSSNFSLDTEPEFTVDVGCVQVGLKVEQDLQASKPIVLEAAMEDGETEHTVNAFFSTGKSGDFMAEVNLDAETWSGKMVVKRTIGMGFTLDADLNWEHKSYRLELNSDDHFENFDHALIVDSQVKTLDGELNLRPHQAGGESCKNELAQDNLHKLSVAACDASCVMRHASACDGVQQLNATLYALRKYKSISNFAYYFSVFLDLDSYASGQIEADEKVKGKFKVDLSLPNLGTESSIIAQMGPQDKRHLYINYAHSIFIFRLETSFDWNWTFRFFHSATGFTLLSASQSNGERISNHLKLPKTWLEHTYEPHELDEVYIYLDSERWYVFFHDMEYEVALKQMDAGKHAVKFTEYNRKNASGQFVYDGHRVSGGGVFFDGFCDFDIDLEVNLDGKVKNGTLVVHDEDKLPLFHMATSYTASNGRYTYQPFDKVEIFYNATWLVAGKLCVSFDDLDRLAIELKADYRRPNMSSIWWRLAHNWETQPHGLVYTMDLAVNNQPDVRLSVFEHQLMDNHTVKNILSRSMLNMTSSSILRPYVCTWWATCFETLTSELKLVHKMEGDFYSQVGYHHKRDGEMQWNLQYDDMYEGETLIYLQYPRPLAEEINNRAIKMRINAMAFDNLIFLRPWVIH